MGADITRGSAGPALRRIGAPAGLFLPGLFQRFAQPVLRIFDLYHADLAQIAMCHHLARLPHHGISRVVMRQHKDRARGFGSFRKLLRLCQRGCQWLVADHMDAAPQELHRNGRMHVVRGHDRDRLNAILAARFADGHVGKAGIDAALGQAKVGTRGQRFFRGRAEAPRHQLELVVDAGGDAVNAANKGVAPAAHHAKPDARGAAFGFTLDRHVTPPAPACGGLRHRPCRRLQNRQRPFRSRG